ncbi:MAG TPA: MFS transporter [bacterium]|nr:MFS transporter [bacterium]
MSVTRNTHIERADRPPVAGIVGARARRVLAICCGVHALHDGYTDVLYVLLTLWRTEFRLGYAEVGLLRALYTGAMAVFQVPVGLLAERIGTRGARYVLLALGTGVAGLGYIAAGASTGFALLAAALVFSGAGSSTQHPVGADLVAYAHRDSTSRRIALSTYNFSGDLGKMAMPAAVAWTVTLLPWRSAAVLLGAVGVAAACIVLPLLRRVWPDDSVTAAPSSHPHGTDADAHAGGVPGEDVRETRRYRGFPLLFTIGLIDSATRMGFLTFLPFLLIAKGATGPTIGLALSLIFAGGAAGKLLCGLFGARFGILATVLATEGLTAAGILALLPSTLGAGLVLLPVLGVALNGTSSVLYGNVPALIPPARRTRAFGWFYTGTIGAGAVAPALYGVVSDAAGVPATLTIVAGVVLLTLPLAWGLRQVLRASGETASR